jgi:hypothetical protein
MLHRKTHVGGPHGPEPLGSAALLVPGFLRPQAQRAKPLRRDGREQRRLIGEMSIQGGARHAKPASDRAQRQGSNPLFLYGLERLLHEGPGQVSVVIAAGAFSGHARIVRPYVDIVNIWQYIDVDIGNIGRPQTRWDMTKLKSALQTLWQTDSRLTSVGLFMIVLLGLTGIGLLVDPREITGAPAWLKPAKFAASIAIYTLTLAWVFTYLPEWVRTRRFVSGITTVVMLLEIAIIDLQAWRGTTSHFNLGTLFDGVLFSIMGLAIVAQTLSTIAVAVALWRHTFADRAMGWALRLGMTITIVGALTGGLMTRPTSAQLESARAGHRMTVSGAHTVGAPDGGPGLPGTGWSTEHGDLRIAHFVGLHALQVLPFVTLVFARRAWNEVNQVRVVWTLSVSYVSLFGLLLWQAFRDQSIMAPDSLTLAVMASWALVTAGAVWNSSQFSVHSSQLKALKTDNW